MQKGHHLEFSCLKCEKPIKFSVFQLSDQREIECESCQKKYRFSDNTLIRQLEKFTNLCRQIQLSEEILDSTCLGIKLGDREVNIPFKLLLTRLNSKLDLTIGDKVLSIQFRMEPQEQVAEIESKN